MKIPIAIPVVAFVLTAHTNAQYAPIKERAREASATTTARQNVTAEGAPTPGVPPGYAARYGLRPSTPPSGAPPGTPPGAPPAGEPAAPATPIKPSAQQTAATKLKTDITEARAASAVTADMKKQFVQDLNAVAKGHVRPSSGTVTRFGESLLATLPAKTASPADDTKLVKALVVSFNSAGLPPARLQELNDEVRTLLTKSGVMEADASVVAENLRAVVSDIQSGAPN